MLLTQAGDKPPRYVSLTRVKYVLARERQPSLEVSGTARYERLYAAIMPGPGARQRRCR